MSSTKFSNQNKHGNLSLDSKNRIKYEKQNNMDL